MDQRALAATVEREAHVAQLRFERREREQALRVVVPLVHQLGLDGHVRERGSRHGPGQGGDLGKSVAGGERGAQREAAASCRELHHGTEQADGEGPVPQAGEAPRVVVERAAHAEEESVTIWLTRRPDDVTIGAGVAPEDERVGVDERAADRSAVQEPARAEVSPLSRQRGGGAGARLSIERVAGDPSGQSKDGLVALFVGVFVEGGPRAADLEVDAVPDSPREPSRVERVAAPLAVADGGVVQRRHR